ncbi:hypothetical protein Tco_0833659, partial [Tanacetum coccineum]
MVVVEIMSDFVEDVEIVVEVVVVVEDVEIVVKVVVVVEDEDIEFADECVAKFDEDDDFGACDILRRLLTKHHLDVETFCESENGSERFLGEMKVED